MNPRAPRHVISDFTPLAPQMREQIERHFRTPEKHGPEHQVWNYWYVPDSYTYLRTNPEKVIERKLAEQFVAQITQFAMTQLGMDHVTWPFLSLYVDGCGQALHNDSRNGSMGYVFSVTKWDERTFSGGETLLFHEQDYWANGRFTAIGATSSFYDLVPARFNQLLLFDDRVPHSVPTVRGVVDPCDGRLVLHGHITARRILLRGPLQQPRHAQSAGARRLVELIKQLVEEHRGRVHGVATFEVRVDAEGTAHDVRTLIDRILPLPGGMDTTNLVARIHEQLSTLRFDPADGESTLAVPFVFQ
jgi:hypothetical protein